MNHITNLYYRGEKYIINKENDYYLAINVKDLDDNGCLTRAMNGLQMFANKKLSDTIERVQDHLDIKANGFEYNDLISNPMLMMDIMNGKYRA